MAKQTRRAPAAARPEKKPKKTAAPRSFREWALEWAKSLGGAFVLFIIIRTFLLQTYVITSGSMENTLLVGDLLTLSRAAYGANVPFTDWRLPGYASPERNDVAVFWGPHQPDLELIKRMVGTPGDTLAMRDAVLFVNGKPQEEPYALPSSPAADLTHPWMEWQRGFLAESVDPATYSPTLHNWGPIVIPENKYFMLGDNRDNSLDSRYWGLVDWSKIKGRASIIYYSYDGTAPGLPVLNARLSRIGDRIR